VQDPDPRFLKAGLGFAGDPPEEVDPPPPEAAPAMAPEPGAVRVLVVDDQPDVLATTIELFKIMGYEVLHASNGLDAVAILKSVPDIQVLFSDVVMPGMNGIELGREARKVNPGINVILASGFQAPGLTASGTDLRDFHFLVKPFRISDVARMLRK
jgi:DNA-binding NtrC family response regulator